MTKLKPCKFCGGGNMYLCKHYDAFVIERNVIFCNDCKTSFYNEEYEEDEDGTRDWWNTRALQIPDTPEMVRALDDAYDTGRKSAEKTCQWVDHGCTRCDYSDYSLFEIPERCPGCGAKVIDWW